MARDLYERGFHAEALMDGKKIVLVVDDEPDLISIAQRALEYGGYHVLTAMSGEKALEVAEQHPRPIDLLLSDIVMPGMGGRELVWRLREAYPNLKVILASGYTDEHGALQLIEDSGAVFLPKPVDIRILLHTVKGVIGESMVHD